MGKKNADLKIIRRFVCALAMISISFTFILYIPTIRSYILKQIYHLSDYSYEFAYSSFIFALFIPIITTIKCYFDGLLMRNKIFIGSGLSGLARVGSIFIGGTILTTFFHKLNGVSLGLLLMVIYGLFELFILLLCLIKQKTLFKNS